MNTKKVLCLLLSLLMVLSMAACGKNKEPNDIAGDTTAAADASGATDEATTAASSETQADTSSEEYDYSKGLTDEGKYESVSSLDYVTLPEYNGMDIPLNIHTITDEELQDAMEEALAEHSETAQVKDRAVVDGDTLNIDYVGSVDGVEFDGGNTNGAGTSVTIGVTNYIDDFLEQLIGHKPGETFDIEVTFPDPYTTNTDLSGKDAVFKITINYIEETVLPELTDAWVKENLTYETVAEFKEVLTKNLIREKELNYIIEYLVENSTVTEIPEAIVKYQEDYVVGYYTAFAQSYGMTLDDLLSQMYGTDVAGLIKQYETNIESAAKEELILQAVIAKENLQVTEADMKAFFKDNAGTEDYSTYLTEWGMGYTKKLVAYSVMMDHILENANLLEQ